MRSTRRERSAKPLRGNGGNRLPKPLRVGKAGLSKSDEWMRNAEVDPALKRTWFSLPKAERIRRLSDLVNSVVEEKERELETTMRGLDAERARLAAASFVNDLELLKLRRALADESIGEALAEADKNELESLQRALSFAAEAHEWTSRIDRAVAKAVAGATTLRETQKDWDRCMQAACARRLQRHLKEKRPRSELAIVAEKLGCSLDELASWLNDHKGDLRGTEKAGPKKIAAAAVANFVGVSEKTIMRGDDAPGSRLFDRLLDLDSEGIAEESADDNFGFALEAFKAQNKG